MENIPELSILVSFIIFLVLFFKKVYPFLIDRTDNYIENIKDKIEEANRLKKEAEIALDKAKQQRIMLEEEIKKYREQSKKRLNQLEFENEKYLKNLELRNNTLLDNQLKAEFEHQKQILLKKLSKLIIEKIEKESNKKILKRDFEFSKDDLQKLQ